MRKWRLPSSIIQKVELITQVQTLDCLNPRLKQVNKVIGKRWDFGSNPSWVIGFASKFCFGSIPISLCHNNRIDMGSTLGRFILEHFWSLHPRLLLGTCWEHAGTSIITSNVNIGIKTCAPICARLWWKIYGRVIQTHSSWPQITQINLGSSII